MNKKYFNTEELTKVFSEVTSSMKDTFYKKNTDYGNSFFQSLDKRGVVAALVRMEDKFNRLDSLSTKDNLVKDESIIDTLLDLANYAIMTAMWKSNRIYDNCVNRTITGADNDIDTHNGILIQKIISKKSDNEKPEINNTNFKYSK